MSEYIMAATIQRQGTLIAGPAMVMSTKMQAKEAVDYQGSNPHFLYKMTTLQIPTSDVQLLRQGDSVVDPANVDPKTNQPRQFLIISDPEPSSLTMSWRWVAERQTRGGQ